MLTLSGAGRISMRHRADQQIGIQDAREMCFALSNRLVNDDLVPGRRIPIVQDFEFGNARYWTVELHPEIATGIGWFVTPIKVFDTAEQKTWQIRWAVDMTLAAPRMSGMNPEIDIPIGWGREVDINDVFGAVHDQWRAVTGV